MEIKPLEERFYCRHVVEVARDLLGKRLVFGEISGIITETEAYRGEDDPASHAFRGRTPRSSIMFGPAGYSYVYLIYGMYYCLNVVAEGEGKPAAVLIRGLMLPQIHLDGPGKLCRHLGITRQHNGVHLVSSREFYITESGFLPDYMSTSRIGIQKAQEKLWRFVIKPESIPSVV